MVITSDIYSDCQIVGNWENVTDNFLTANITYANDKHGNVIKNRFNDYLTAQIACVEAGDGCQFLNMNQGGFLMKKLTGSDHGVLVDQGAEINSLETTLYDPFSPVIEPSYGLYAKPNVAETFCPHGT